MADTDGGMRTFRVDRIDSAEPTGEPVVRPTGFDLAEHWAEVVARMDDIRTPVSAIGTAAPEAVPILRAVFGKRMALMDTAGPAGRVGIELRGASIRALAAEVAGFGDLVHIDAPDDLGELLGELGAQLLEMYPRR